MTEKERTSKLEIKTRDLIKSCFLEMYRTLPLNRIFVKDLCEACYISRGTFYVYFDGIPSLYQSCQNELIADMEQDLTETMLWSLVQTHSDKRGWKKSFSQCIRKYSERYDTYHIMITGSEETAFRIAWVSSVRNKFMETLNFVDVQTKEEKEYIAQFFAGGLVSTLSYWIKTGCKEEPEMVASVCEHILFNGALKK